VQADTLLLDPEDVARKITPRTRAIAAVDYAGQPCDYDALRSLAERHGLKLVSDACHALGGSFGARKVGALADLSTFSFHPVKPITTGEGGAITTDDATLAAKMRVFRSHGIVSDFRQREKAGAWAYEMTSLGFNYRLPDLACALGITQLRKLPAMLARREAIAALYDAGLRDRPHCVPLALRPGRVHGRHLYVVKLRESLDRDAVFRALREARIGVNVHYAPVHLHPFYRERFGHAPGLCPVAEREFRRILSLPIFPQMTDADAHDVLAALAAAAGGPE
jgi:perosamine synthetase